MNLIKGLASNSASPTDTWIVSTPKYNGPVFLKWFAYMDKTPEMLGMMYESKVYLTVTNPLIEHKVCPHFVKAIAAGEDQPLRVLLDVLKSTTIAPNYLEVVMKRSLFFQIHGEINRPSITDMKDVDKYKDVKFPKKVVMGFTATEAIDGKTITMQDFVTLLVDMKNDTPSRIRRYSQRLIHLLFQLATTSYAMHLAKMIHNDLHLGNVWVKQQSARTSTYAIDDDIYTFRSDCFSMIYDFDRSYAKQLGDNPLLNAFLCNQFSSCNRLKMGMDLLKVHCYLHAQLANTPFHPIVRRSLFMLMKQQQTAVDKITVYLKTPGCFLNKEVVPQLLYASMPDDLYDLVEPAPTYIKNLSSMVEGMTNAATAADHVYICSKNMFDNNGVVNPARRPALNYRVTNPQGSSPLLFSTAMEMEN